MVNFFHSITVKLAVGLMGVALFLGATNSQAKQPPSKPSITENTSSSVFSVFAQQELSQTSSAASVSQVQNEITKEPIKLLNTQETMSQGVQMSNSASTQVPAAQKTYAESLFEYLSVGDISSAQCGSIGHEKLDSQLQTNFDPLGLHTPRLEYFTYLYAKHRCVGETSMALQGNYSNGHTDTIIDLSTGQVLVTCTLDYTTKHADVHCSDVTGRNWDFSDDMVPGSPYPIYSSTYLTLQKIGGQ